jgi:hypothetical protein
MPEFAQKNAEKDLLVHGGDISFTPDLLNG